MASTSEASDADQGRGSTDRWLRVAALIFLVTFVGHTADHLRRGLDSIPTEVEVLGNLGTVLTVAALALAFGANRWAPVAAVAAGLPLALGFAAVHLLPDWGRFSDSFPSGDVDALSWLAASGEIAGALVFACTGIWVLRRRGLRSVVAAPGRSASPIAEID
jgi:hypothetical protein